ncbi:polygalacturonase-like [Corylus avellana]|uniref:polygalacturonase-like n=1 Tax=Corylus avellana TaxID=13451 RepID=UPI00286A335C|nr:polygalacturonase-like [Corylus avellana]
MAKLLCLLYALFFILYFSHPSHAIRVYDVVSFEAKADGTVDSTLAFHNAWAAACASADSSTINVPKGTYLLASLALGDCKSSYVTFRIDGTLMPLWDGAEADYRNDYWLSFEGFTGVSITGGSLDAKGPALWACKASAADCPTGATGIDGLMSVNSQMFHIVFNGFQNVHVERVKIIAAGDSPNTDGIHVQLSQDVTIMESTIKTGDDCISIGPGTKNLWIERIKCGPGHGISIGSLEKDTDEAGVQNVTVKNAVFIGTQNGLRIKSWARPSNGFVQRVCFLRAIMKNVQNPIVIDQSYCPHNICPTQVSGVKISDVIYRHIRGTSVTKVAIKFDCSSKNPSTGIRLENVNLTCPNQVPESSCRNAIGNTLGFVQPNSCLL